MLFTVKDRLEQNPLKTKPHPYAKVDLDEAIICQHSKTALHKDVNFKPPAQRTSPGGSTEKKTKGLVRCILSRCDGYDPELGL